MSVRCARLSSTSRFRSISKHCCAHGGPCSPRRGGVGPTGPAPPHVAQYAPSVRRNLTARNRRNPLLSTWRSAAVVTFPTELLRDTGVSLICPVRILIARGKGCSRCLRNSARSQVRAGTRNGECRRFPARESFARRAATLATRVTRPASHAGSGFRKSRTLLSLCGRAPCGRNDRGHACGGGAVGGGSGTAAAVCFRDRGHSLSQRLGPGTLRNDPGAAPR